MIIKDIHASIGRYGESDLYIQTLDEVLAAQDASGIFQSAIVDNLSAKFEVMECNARLLKEAELRPAMTPVLTLLPPSFAEAAYSRAELISILDSRRELLFKVFPADHGLILANWQFSWIFDLLEESRAALMVKLDDIDLRDLVTLKTERPGLRIIITDTTQWKNRMVTQIIKTFDDVYMDTCNVIEYFGIEMYCKEIGSEKLLFGSNTPFKEPYDTLFTLQMANISEEEKANIAHRNYEILAGRRDS